MIVIGHKVEWNVLAHRQPKTWGRGGGVQGSIMFSKWSIIWNRQVVEYEYDSIKVQLCLHNDRLFEIVKCLNINMIPSIIKPSMIEGLLFSPQVNDSNT
jgi:hypothetical protein